MFIKEDLEGKIKKLYNLIDSDFLGLTLKDKSKQLVIDIVKLFPSIIVVGMPTFVIETYSPPHYNFTPPPIDKIEINVNRIAFEASSWKFSDIHELINFLKSMEIVYLYKIEMIQVPNTHLTNPSTFISVRMVPLGWTDILRKGLHNYKF